MTAITAFIRRRPVLTYYILAFTISWGGILLVIGGHGGQPRTQDEFTTQVVFAIPAMLAGPSVAGILMTGLVAGWAVYWLLSASVVPPAYSELRLYNGCGK